jgi:hypothetical protein
LDKLRLDWPGKPFYGLFSKKGVNWLYRRLEALFSLILSKRQATLLVAITLVPMTVGLIPKGA